MTTCGYENGNHQLTSATPVGGVFPATTAPTVAQLVELLRAQLHHDEDGCDGLHHPGEHDCDGTMHPGQPHDWYGVCTGLNRVLGRTA